MSIRNAKLGGSDWTRENPSHADMNDTNDAIIDSGSQGLILSGLNLIRQLMDRDISFCGGGMIDGWGDAYIDANGRKNSVDTGNTTALFNTNLYSNLGAGVDILDTSSGTNATTITTTGTITNNNFYFSSVGVNTLGVSISVTVNIKRGSTTIATKTATINNTPISFVPSDYSEFFQNNDTFVIEITSSSNMGKVNGTVSETNSYFNFSSQEFMYNEPLTYTPYILPPSSVIVFQDIPSGTFSSTISKVIGIPFIEDWEDGNNITFKLTNTTEDSGWLNCNNSPSIQNFIAFTSEPTGLQIRLTPKSSSATQGNPSIKGFVVYEV